MKLTQKKACGFTLVELLVTVTVIVLLAGLAMTGYQAATRQARKTKEIAAARSLVAAYLAYPTDNNGELLPGYEPGASVELSNGDVLSGPTAERYPWRLVAYSDPKLEEAMLLNPAKQGGSDSANRHYMVSLVPALGLNAYCLGGYRTTSGVIASSNCAMNLLQLGGGGLSKLIVFASAQLKQGTTTYEGNFIIKPPTMTKSMNIHARYGGKAVVAYLDGHVEVNTPAELTDSRKWSAFAQSATHSIKP